MRSATHAESAPRNIPGKTAEITCVHPSFALHFNLTFKLRQNLDSNELRSVAFESHRELVARTPQQPLPREPDRALSPQMATCTQRSKRLNQGG